MCLSLCSCYPCTWSATNYCPMSDSNMQLDLAKLGITIDLKSSLKDNKLIEIDELPF